MFLLMGKSTENILTIEKHPKAGHRIQGIIQMDPWGVQYGRGSKQKINHQAT